MKIDLNQYITSNNFFKWSEALWLPSIHVHHIPSDEEIANIITLCERLDKARKLVGKPFLVSCWIRPTSVNCDNPDYQGFNYNALVKGTKSSAHIKGQAVDIHPSGITVDKAQNILRPHLMDIQLAAEQNGAAVKRNWLHLQSRPLPKGDPYRFFLP